MKREIDVNKIKVIYDKEQILERIKELQYDEESYDGRSVVDTCKDFSVSEEEFNRKKADFLKRAEELLLDEVELFKILENSIATNKNGSMTKRRRNVVTTFGAYRDYDNEYGCHSYTVDALMVDRVSEFQGELVLSYYTEQSSF